MTSYDFALKSDQNGIETILFTLGIYIFLFKLKSDQNGIETHNGASEGEDYWKVLKSDQNGIETKFPRIAEFFTIKVEIRPKWD